MDTIANFLNALKNARGRERSSCVFPATRLTAQIADALARNGYVAEVIRRGKKRRMLEIRFASGEREQGTAMAGARRISRLSRRVYRRVHELYRNRASRGTLVLSTPLGVLTADEARKRRVGGEVLFEVW